MISDREWYRSDPEGHLRELASISEEIDEVSARMMSAPSIPSELKHYLAKRSFEKALTFIETGHEVG